MYKKLKRLGALCLALCLSAGLAVVQAAAAPVNGFTDVADTAWYADAVEYVSENGLMSGTGGSTFAPEIPLTRAMFVTVLGRMAGADVEAYGDKTPTFADVPAGQWYSAYVMWAVDNGVTSGYSDTAFGPNDNITREQMATMLGRYVVGTGQTLPIGDPRTNEDMDAISVWAQEWVDFVQSYSLMEGDDRGYFKPQNNTTRAEAATVFMRLDKLMAGIDRLLGVYEGQYTARQGDTALTLIVYENGGEYWATFNFYNLPGHTNAAEGCYTMKVTQTGPDDFSLSAEQWIERPTTYDLLDLEGTLDGDSFSGETPTPFTLKRVSDTVDLADVQGVYEGDYTASGITRQLTLSVEEQDGATRAVFDFADLPGKGTVAGSYEMAVYPLMDGGYAFLAGSWIDRPSGFNTVNLRGVLEGNTLSGTDPIPFTVVRAD